MLTEPFYLQTTEVTQGQWAEIMGENPSEFDRCGKDCPVENVSWDDCQEFIRRLNQRERTNKYRLPLKRNGSTHAAPEELRHLPTAPLPRVDAGMIPI